MSAETVTEALPLEEQRRIAVEWIAHYEGELAAAKERDVAVQRRFKRMFAERASSSARVEAAQERLDEARRRAADLLGIAAHPPAQRSP